jgi:hypothetical protein
MPIAAPTPTEARMLKKESFSIASLYFIEAQNFHCLAAICQSVGRLRDFYAVVQKAGCGMAD